MSDKEATARIKINKLLEAAGWRFFQEGDATALPFVDASFDLVFCRTAVHHFPDPAVVVAEMARVCRPGGRVAIADLIVLGVHGRPAVDLMFFGSTTNQVVRHAACPVLTVRR